MLPGSIRVYIPQICINNYDRVDQSCMIFYTYIHNIYCSFSHACMRCLLVCTNHIPCDYNLCVPLLSGVEIEINDCINLRNYMYIFIISYAVQCFSRNIG